MLKKSNEFDVNHWRKRFTKSKNLLNGNCLQVLIAANSFFETKEGIHTWSNIRNGRASLEKTRMAVLILEKYLAKTTKKNYLKKIED